MKKESKNTQKPGCAKTKGVKRKKQYYRSQRTRNLYNQESTKPFKISRSKLELFVKCPRCFYIDRKLGVGRPPGYPFTLNNAVDELLKKEFDTYRLDQMPHPLCLENNVNVIPFKHENMDRWRDSLHEGIQFLVPNTNIMLCGGIDDIWIDTETEELIVVDYKATSKASAISLDADWQISYKRQAEVYQWLLRKNGFLVSNTAYFVYCNGKKDAKLFGKKLDFEISLIPYIGNDYWVDTTIIRAYQCLKSDIIPLLTEECYYCQYWKSVKMHVLDS